MADGRAAGLEVLKLSLRGDDTCPVLHAEPVHLLRELPGEFLGQVSAQQILAKRLQDPLLHLAAADR